MKLLKLPAGNVLYGEFDPCEDIAKLIFHSRGGCLGIAGLLLTEQSVTDWPADLREIMSRLFQKFPVIYAADSLTVEWGPHYGITPKLGEHPEWCDTNNSKVLLREAKSYQGAAYCARRGIPFYLRIHPRDGQADSKQGRPDTYHLLHRFAGRYGVPQDRIVYGDAPAPEGLEGPTVAPERVSQAKAEAQAMLDAITAQRPAEEPEAALEEMLSGEKKEPSGRRRIHPGTVFDPSTHYQADYYDGSGVEYMQPDGTWAIYHGTGLRWGGNELVARFIREIGESFGKRLLDYGCSAGDFLSHLHRAGWFVRGFDISQAAIDRAPPDVRPLLSTKPPGVAMAPRFDHVTAWDLLEHVWSKDIDELLAMFNCCLRTGGLLWANVCTRGEQERDYELVPGVKFTPANSWLLVSGHVTIKRWWWWRKQIRSAGFKIREDIAYRWQVRRAEDPAFLAGSASWSPRNFIVAEKV